ncbi:hypothetical protein ACOMICROBIO_NCLOACGD_04503 [Vibrio sp. B1ASS3]|nr:hypothetical protein ACOMICROBIO_NCLOACGD_04503 [Vibrio sp. B1ASS3]CAE6953551.1 hypothetical protein ACOMICROBIO_NCLOACGD_04503 [Vibrio sp. B1ASS3]
MSIVCEFITKVVFKMSLLVVMGISGVLGLELIPLPFIH